MVVSMFFAGSIDADNRIKRLDFPICLEDDSTFRMRSEASQVRVSSNPKRVRINGFARADGFSATANGFAEVKLVNILELFLG